MTILLIVTEFLINKRVSNDSLAEAEANFELYYDWWFCKLYYYNFYFFTLNQIIFCSLELDLSD